MKKHLIEDGFMSNRTFIDEEKFALAFAKSNTKCSEFDDKQIVRKSKEFLMSYLTAYYLVQKFNGIEKESFSNATKTNFEDLTFEQLKKKVRDLNKY